MSMQQQQPWANVGQGGAPVPGMPEEQDRMSALPDAVLHQILSLLPTKHSIQTSILSKRWIHLWKFTPAIDIPYNDITPSERSGGATWT
ncbi:hypothetical protein V6N11_044446 [Hibiscus sabdariffa]|uniref:F-box domain-containing protein n=1 Tax=Hibiscus sabdariffa TaxID=183260 RepID=A0ABR2RFH6_9ROSI